jgi:hypothetical protein
VVNSGQLDGAVNNWPVTGNFLFVETFGLWSLPGNRLPTGSRLTIALENDASGNVTGVTWVVFDSQGVNRAKVTKSMLSFSGVTAADLAPITAFELNLVGPDNGQNVVLSGGKGTITYEATTRLRALGLEPACTEVGFITAETANSHYGELPSSPSNSFTQLFSASTLPMTHRPGNHSLVMNPRVG